MEKALQDLLWLSNRLSGILELKDELKNYSDLKNRTKELIVLKDKYFSEVQELENTISKLKDTISEANSELKLLQESKDTYVSNMNIEVKKEANSITNDAHKQAESILKAANSKATEVEKKIKEKNKKLLELEFLVSTQEDKYSKITKALEDLKGKL